jgi:hypothetical protein
LQRDRIYAPYAAAPSARPCMSSSWPLKRAASRGSSITSTTRLLSWPEVVAALDDTGPDGLRFGYLIVFKARLFGSGC